MTFPVPKVVLKNAAWCQSSTWGLLCRTRHCCVASSHHLRFYAHMEDEQRVSVGEGTDAFKDFPACLCRRNVTQITEQRLGSQLTYARRARETSGSHLCVSLTCSCTVPVVFFSRLTACEWLMPSADVPQMLTMRSPICKSRRLFTHAGSRDNVGNMRAADSGFLLTV